MEQRFRVSRTDAVGSAGGLIPAELVQEISSRGDAEQRPLDYKKRLRPRPLIWSECFPHAVVSKAGERNRAAAALDDVTQRERMEEEDVADESSLHSDCGGRREHEVNTRWRWIPTTSRCCPSEMPEGRSAAIHHRENCEADLPTQRNRKQPADFSRTGPTASPSDVNRVVEETHPWSPIPENRKYRWVKHLNDDCQPVRGSDKRYSRFS